MTGNFVRFIDAGVDWITVTCDDPIKKTGLEVFVTRIANQERLIGEEVKPWSMYGFEGLRVSSLQYGWNDAAFLVRASSTLAHEHWRRIGEAATNCSRLDVQATVEYTEEPNSAIRRHMRQMTKWRKQRESAPTLSIYHEASGPSTVYVGKRISDRYGRIYNKAAESKLDHYNMSVRYEVEFKNTVATRMLNKLLLEPDPHAACIGIVRTYFANRGAFLRWPLSDTSLNSESPRTRTTVHRRLEWLGTSVKSAVQDLIRAGYYEEVVAALGLTLEVSVRNGERTTVDTIH